MKPRILPDELLRSLAREYGTPLYVYDLDRVLARARGLASGFDVVRYAQKANANLALLGELARAGVAVDAVSTGEIERVLRAGFEPERIVYTADLFDHGALERIREHALHVNAGSRGMLPKLAQACPGASVTLRVNPGFGAGHDKKVMTGGEGNKHGVWHADLEEIANEARSLGLRVTGLHVHVGSGYELEESAHAAERLAELAPLAGPDLAVLSAGGGIPVPYKPDDREPDVARYTKYWRDTRDRVAAVLGRSIALETEPGRYLVAAAGLLLTEVREVKSSGGPPIAIVDAGFHTLVRPVMYGAYQHISLVGEAREGERATIVAGPLCESGDLLTQTKGGVPDPRPLPPLESGDLLCAHDAGAYGAAMASNYNSHPLPAEVLVRAGQPSLVRRRQTIDEMLGPEIL